MMEAMPGTGTDTKVSKMRHDISLSMPHRWFMVCCLNRLSVQDIQGEVEQDADRNE